MPVTKITGDDGDVVIASSTLGVIQWEARSRRKWADTTDSASAGYEQSIVSVKSSTADIVVHIDATSAISNTVETLTGSTASVICYLTGTTRGYSCSTFAIDDIRVLSRIGPQPTVVEITGHSIGTYGFATS